MKRICGERENDGGIKMGNELETNLFKLFIVIAVRVS